MKFSDVVKKTISEYLKARIGFIKIIWLEKAASVVTFIITYLIAFYSVSFALVCGGFLFSFVYMENNDKSYMGFLFSAAFFFVLAFLALVLKGPLVTNNLIRLLQSVFFSDEDEKK